MARNEKKEKKGKEEKTPDRRSRGEKKRMGTGQSEPKQRRDASPWRSWHLRQRRAGSRRRQKKKQNDETAEDATPEMNGSATDQFRTGPMPTVTPVDFANVALRFEHLTGTDSWPVRRRRTNMRAHTHPEAQDRASGHTAGDGTRTAPPAEP